MPLGWPVGTVQTGHHMQNPWKEKERCTKIVSLNDLPHIPASHPVYGPGPVWSPLPTFCGQCALLSAGTRGTLIGQFCGKEAQREPASCRIYIGIHIWSQPLNSLLLQWPTLKIGTRESWKHFAQNLPRVIDYKAEYSVERKERKLQVPSLGEGSLETPLHPYCWDSWPLPGSQGSLSFLLSGTGKGLSRQSLRLYSPPNTAKPRHCDQDSHLEGKSTALAPVCVPVDLRKSPGAQIRTAPLTRAPQTQSEWSLSSVLPWSLRRVTSSIPIPAPAGVLEAPAAV